MSTDDSQPREGQALGPADEATLEAEEVDSLVEKPLEYFDWEEVQSKLDAELQSKDEELDKLYNEYADLQDFFSIWFDSGGKIENERARKRQKTQQHYVKHTEEQLEKDRERYVGVMNAFRSAMEMLK